MLAIFLLVIGILSRIVMHEPNFTPVIALALFGGVYLKKDQAVWMPLTLMMLSDLALGLHAVIPFTWGSVLLISLLGRRERERRNAGWMVGLSIFSAVLFFAVTNFGAWLVMYPKTFEGFVQCYVMAIPFFRNTLLSAVLYSSVLFGVYELVARWVKETKLAWIAG
jgi:hypothetical protein